MRVSTLEGGGEDYETLRMKIKISGHRNKVGILSLIISVAGIRTIYGACLKNPNLRNTHLNREYKNTSTCYFKHVKCEKIFSQ
jgi:hypothetical protein